MQRDTGRRCSSTGQGERLGTDPFLMALRRNWFYSHWFQVSSLQNFKTIYFSCVNYTACGSLLQQLQQTNTCIYTYNFTYNAKGLKYPPLNIFLRITVAKGSPVGSAVKNLTASAADMGWVSDPGRPHRPCDSCCACALEPGSYSDWDCLPQLLTSAGTCALQREASMRSPRVTGAALALHN